MLQMGRDGGAGANENDGTSLAFQVYFVPPILKGLWRAVLVSYRPGLKRVLRGRQLDIMRYFTLVDLLG